jgi:hypothetical protein
MRLFCRVFLIVLLIAVSARAADMKQPTVTEQTFTVQAPVTTNTADLTRGTMPAHAAAPRKIPSDSIELREPCLTMRSIRFTRHGRDRVQYQGTSTCTPANQFQVKRAVIPLPAP